jgi:restriction system protein
MPVPNFQAMTVPLLRFAADGKERSLAEARDPVASELGLSDGERKELLPSGRQGRFANRLAWAKIYFEKAGLLASPRRGHFQITDRGREVLDSPPSQIDIKYLAQFPEFVAFRSRKGTRFKAGDSDTETPEEALESAHLKVQAALSSELVERLKGVSPQFIRASHCGALW